MSIVNLSVLAAERFWNEWIDALDDLSDRQQDEAKPIQVQWPMLH